MAADTNGCTSDIISEVSNVPRQPAILEKQKSESSRVGEKNRVDARAGYKQEESRKRKKG